MNNTYTLKHFASWIESYPTWAELKAYITSEAGGKLDIVENDNQNNEVIIRYDKKSSDMTRDYVRWCRSVVWDCERNRPLSVATPKAADITNDMMSKTGDICEGLQFENFYEGVTMNIYKATDGSKKIATRTKLGASGNFYSQRSFAELYKEACVASGEPELADDMSFKSIIVQHPEHRIVGRITKPQIIVLHSGSIAADGTVTITECVPAITERPAATVTIKDWFTELTLSKGWEWQGIVIKDGKGNRWRLRSNVYRLVRSLRGETPRPDERFFLLRSRGMVKSYLFYYPEDRQRYWDYETWLRTATEEVFALYCAVYKERSKDFADVPKKYQTHLAGIHALYTGQLRAANKTVNKAVARDYMNGLPVPRLLFLMNHDLRRRHRLVQQQVAPMTLAVPLVHNP